MSDESSMRAAVHDAARSIPVGAAPSRAALEAAAEHTASARPSWWRPLAAAAAVLLVLALSFSLLQSAPSSDRPFATDGASSPTAQVTSTNPMEDMPGREAVRAYLAENPGIPLVVFKNLPPGYTWRGPSSLATTGGKVSMRASIFTTTPVDAGPILIVCSEQRPGQCPRGDYRVRRTVGGTTVTIAVTGTAPESRLRDLLRNAPLSSALSVGWLPN